MLTSKHTPLCLRLIQWTHTGTHTLVTSLEESSPTGNVCVVVFQHCAASERLTIERYMGYIPSVSREEGGLVTLRVGRVESVSWFVCVPTVKNLPTPIELKFPLVVYFLPK